MAKKKVRELLAKISSNPEYKNLITEEKEQKDWERGVKILNETGIQLANTEAEWITETRNYCRDNEIFPPHILKFYKEHHTEKAPE